MPVFSVIILLQALIIFAWRNDSGFAYVMGAFLGIFPLFYIIGNGFVGEAPYALAGTVALLGIGYVRAH